MKINNSLARENSRYIFLGRRAMLKAENKLKNILNLYIWAILPGKLSTFCLAQAFESSLSENNQEKPFVPAHPEELDPMHTCRGLCWGKSCPLPLEPEGKQGALWSHSVHKLLRKQVGDQHSKQTRCFSNSEPLSGFL